MEADSTHNFPPLGILSYEPQVVGQAHVVLMECDCSRETFHMQNVCILFDIIIPFYTVTSISFDATSLCDSF